MSAIAELEAALRAAWDHEILAVYADALQVEGDPRGAVIAIDLQIAATGETAALARARHIAQAGWLGDLATLWSVRSTQLGLIDAVLSHGTSGIHDGDADAILTSPARRYLRDVTLFADARGVARMIERLATAPLPWLQRVVIDQVDRGTVPRSAVAALEAAAPNLRALDLRGERVMATPLPASVRRLGVQGRSALVVTSAPAAGIEALDLAFVVPDDTALRALAPLVNPRSFPDLVELDLARNEAIYPHAHPSNVDPLSFVAAIELRERLRRLRLPSVRLPSQAAAIDELLRAHPMLEVEIARCYRSMPASLAPWPHPRLHVAPAVPWLPREQLPGNDALRILLERRGGDAAPAAPQARHEAVLLLARCAEVLEQRFATMSPPARAGWTLLWATLDGMPFDAHYQLPARPFPVAPLVAALSEVPSSLDRRCADAAALLREARLASNATVNLQRGGW